MLKKNQRNHPNEHTIHKDMRRGYNQNKRQGHFYGQIIPPIFINYKNNWNNKEPNDAEERRLRDVVAITIIF